MTVPLARTAAECRLRRRSYDDSGRSGFDRRTARFYGVAVPEDEEVKYWSFFVMQLMSWAAKTKQKDGRMKIPTKTSNVPGLGLV